VLPPELEDAVELDADPEDDPEFDPEEPEFDEEELEVDPELKALDVPWSPAGAAVAQPPRRRAAIMGKPSPRKTMRNPPQRTCERERGRADYVQTPADALGNEVHRASAVRRY
jgi:hypothetical protein